MGSHELPVPGWASIIGGARVASRASAGPAESCTSRRIILYVLSTELKVLRLLKEG